MRLPWKRRNPIEDVSSFNEQRLAQVEKRLQVLEETVRILEVEIASYEVQK